jgi:D-alanyl-D-alanine carboxypeptidase (penicillin-binding protein 5/6)
MLGMLVLVAIAGGYVVYCYCRTLAPVEATINQFVLKTQPTVPLISWPSQGQSAAGVLGTNILTSHGVQTSVPTASTAKMITALMILRAKPLNVGEQGPTITLSASDVAIYDTYLGEDGSLVPVVAGEQITEYQMLEAMLLPSANNMADSLAIWAYGSLANYAVQANSFVASEGFSHTHIGSDASGFQPNTVSTASDLVKIGELVMQNPVLSQIVGQTNATGIPVVNNIKNVNSLLGQDNIVGIKTGNSNQAGGVFVAAANTVIDGQPETVVTANLGAATLANALSGSQNFIKSAQTNFIPIPLIKKGELLANYRLPWTSNPVRVIANADFKTSVWGGDDYGAIIKLNNISYGYHSGEVVGEITNTGNEVPKESEVSAILAKSVPKPGLVWRMLHP